jgi:hypothetical protein
MLLFLKYLHEFFSKSTWSFLSLFLFVHFCDTIFYVFKYFSYFILYT